MIIFFVLIFLIFLRPLHVNTYVKKIEMRDFTTGSEAKHIFNFALPMLIGNVFMQLYQLVDSVIVGQYLGKEALAAVGASTPVVFLTIALIMGMGIGASIVISQYYGAKQYEKVRLTSDTMMIFLFGAGIVVTLFGTIFSRHVLQLMQLPEDIIPHATEYLRIYFGGSILLFGYNSAAAILRGVGDSKTPLYFLIISAVLNIGLDLLFIVTFSWGIAGAAWATVISQGVAFFLLVIYINRKKDHIVHIELLRPKFDKAIFKHCLQLGLPTGFQQTFVAIGMLALMSVVNGFGTDVIAGYTSAMRIDTLVALPAMNFAAALTSFVGQNMGAGNFDRIRRGLWATLKMTTITCLTLNLLIIVFGRYVMMLFTSDVAVIDYGRDCLIVLNSFYFLFSTMFVINGLLRGAGATIVPMFVTLLSLWLVRVPVATILSHHFGPEGIWWAIPIGWAVGLMGAMAYYWSGRWKRQSVVKNIDTNIDI